MFVNYELFFRVMQMDSSFGQLKNGVKDIWQNRVQWY